MPTGACGINCDICRLNLLGLCASCGPGKSAQAQIKLATMERVLGSPCPILACAVMNHIDFCIRDCSQFPCDNYHTNGYPFSEHYLQMQQRRRGQPVLQMDPMGKPVAVPSELWQAVAKRDLNMVRTYTLADVENEQRLSFQFLNRILVLDLKTRTLLERIEGNDTILENPMLTLVVLSYFKAVDRLFPLGKDMISTKDMQQAMYFQGENSLRTEPVLRRFQDDDNGFKQAIQGLGGEQLDLVDTSAVLYPFARVPVYYLIWKDERQDGPSLSILFDRSIESVLEPPVIWGLIQVVNAWLICG